MVLPAVLGALSNPWVLSAIGGFLPGVVSALTGSPTEEEAKAKVAPERARLLEEFAKAGVSGEQAEHLADEAVSKGVKEAMDEGGVPEWLTLIASVAGTYGGFKASKWLRSGKAAATGKAVDAGKAAAAAPAATAAAEVAPAVAGPFVSKKALSVDDARAFASKAPPREPALRDPPDASPQGGPFESGRDPLTGGPRSLRRPHEDMPVDPLTGAPRSNVHQELPVASDEPPAFMRSPFTGGRAYGPDESAAFGAAARNSEADDIARRVALDEIAMAEAAAKPRQMNAMRSYDDVQRNRGNLSGPFVGAEEIMKRRRQMPSDYELAKMGA